jgi:HEAT repeat protein
MTTAAPRNAAGLTDHNLKLLNLVLAKLNEQDAQLHDRIVCYLLDGEDEAVLADVAKEHNVAGHLRLGCAQQYNFGYRDAISWRSFIRDVQSQDPKFYRRIANVFEAAARHLPPDRFCCQQELDNDRGLEVLLQEATASNNRPNFAPDKLVTGFSASVVLEMISTAGRSPEKYLTAAFRADRSWQGTRIRDLFLNVPGLGPHFAAHRDLIAPFLAAGPAENRVVAVENLGRTQTPPAAFAQELVACATDSSKTLRETAEPLVRAMPQEARPLLEELAKGGNRNQREQAVRLLGRICGQDSREFLKSLLESEKTQPVREAIEAALTEADVSSAPQKPDLTAPPRQPLPLNPPVTPALREVLDRLFQDYDKCADQHNEKLANKQPKQYIYPNHELKHAAPELIEQVTRMLEHGGQVQGILRKLLGESRYAWGQGKGPYQAFFEHPDCQLVHAIRLLAMVGQISGGDNGLEFHGIQTLETFRNSHEPRFTLEDLAEGIRSLGLPDDNVMSAALHSYYGCFDWEPEAVWPFYLQKLDRLLAAFAPPSSTDWNVRWRQQNEQNGAFRLLAKFPLVPPQLVGKLWEISLGTSKADRQKAQPVCEKLPDLFERLTQALGSSNAHTRTVAAEWLGRLGDKRAVAPLAAAAKKEKQDAAIDAMLTALERLGESIASFLDREKLQADAVKNLKKGTPPALAWFPWASLPQVHWKDTGQPVPAQTLTWLIVQSYKLKSPEPGPLLARYCELMQPAQREELGTFVLKAWLSQDLLRKHTDAECRTLAQQQAPARWQMYQGALPYYQQHNQPVPASFPQSLADCQEQIFRELQRHVGSAAGEKGILAVAGACCGDAAVGPVQQYLKEWYGHRAAQCKALIAMLSGVDRPLAIQYLLSISNRFRTKGIREEAEKYVNLLAERKGWTLDELADRTMPTCGLDDEGKLELSFGPRSFTASVNAELEVVLYDSEGKALKKLPDPRKDDDAELAKAAKKAFSAVKSDLKKFVGLTSTRLYEAMCTERTWPAADWKMYLHAHPLARFLCQRLVWAVLPTPLPVGEGRGEGVEARGRLAHPHPNPLPRGEGADRAASKVIATFRPLDDGTLTDAQDNAVTLPDDAQIRLAHSCNVAAEASQAWLTHLADYSIEPLFTQFGRPAYELPEEKRRETVVRDFQGHMLEAFKLRGLATKLGYTRGQAEDGGWFYEYLKSFPGLGLEVHLGFSGNGLPEENRTVALTTLSFERKKAEPQQVTPMFGRTVTLPLKDIPPVLLTECIGDLRSIAAAGSGFDPDWEKKALL